MRLLRPVAAADYFLKPRGLGWFATNIIGIIPVARGRAKEGGNPLAECEAALDRDDILILFPEGSRGVPEALGLFKKGIGHLAKARANVPVIPRLHAWARQGVAQGVGPARSLQLRVSVGEPVYGQDSYEALVRELEAAMTALAAQKRVPAWD